jgi:tetratricopeptide (TPR) repeat protein
VIGRRFSYRLLNHLSGDGDVLNQHLVTLQRAELVREAARAPELEYVFRHELTRDAAYQTILHRRLRQVHLRVGEAIEAFYPDRLDQEADRLAGHFYAARDFERALKYYLLAGDAAARLYANREAAASYGKALEIARTRASDDQLSEIYTRRGRAMELYGEYDKSLENYQELERLGREGGKLSLELAGLIPQTTIFSTPNVMHNSQRGRELSQRALTLARQLNDPRAEAKALWNLMMLIVYNNEDPQSAIQYGEQSLAIARQHNLREEMAYGLHDLGRTYLITGQWEKGWAASEEARQLWLELGNQPLLADNLTTVAETLYLTGNFEQAIQNAQEALRINRSIGSEWGQAYSLATIAPIYLEWGEIDEAVQAILESITLARRANFRPPLLTGPFLLTLIYFDLGHLGKSLEAIQETISLSESLVEMQHYRPVLKALKSFLEGDAAGASRQMKEASGKIMIDVPDIYLGPMIIALACEIEQAHGDYEEVLRITEAALGKMKAANVPILLPDLLYYQGRARVALGQLDEGLRLLEASVEEARRLGSRRSLWPVLAEMAHLAVQRGDADQADILRREGREVVEYIASHIGSHELQASFIGLPQVQWLMEG